MLNGSAPDPAPTATQVKVHFIQKPAGAVLRFVTGDGGYLGSIDYDAMTPQALAAMANAFQGWVAQQTNALQIVPGSAIAGLRS